MKLFERLQELMNKKEKKALEPSRAEVTPALPLSFSPTATTMADVLVQAVVSEKGAKAEASGAYIFVVHKDANKIKIKQAVKERYGVSPSQVRIINLEGKRLRWGQVPGKRSDWKKAVVTLPKGKTISIHEGV